MGTTEEFVLQRRALLQAITGAAISSAVIGLPISLAAANQAAGKRGDFDFLAGKWKINHRKLNSNGKDWDEFKGEATCWSILNGVGSIEELCIPERNPIGMGLRLLDVEKQVWSDYWIGAKSGVLTIPGLTGAFEDGVGTFVADDVDGDQPIKVRGVWDRITPASCRWRQGVSQDGGKTWKEDWFMDWIRA